MLTMFYFYFLVLEAALTSSPSDPSIATETYGFTLVWNYTLSNRILLGRFFNVTGNNEEIARREGSGITNVLGNFQGQFHANISDTHAWLKIREVKLSDKGRYALDLALSPNGGFRSEVDVIVHCK